VILLLLARDSSCQLKPVGRAAQVRVGQIQACNFALVGAPMRHCREKSPSGTM
jgi:hypothetical protein